tara:strand:+ start:178 stop:516 length:339 start_codon:yes stop_codon:yes gene_type:complete
MAPPLRAYGTHRAWRLPFTILISMVRVIGRESGKAEPAVMLNVDMTLGPVEAKELLVREAAEQIKLLITLCHIEEAGGGCVSEGDGRSSGARWRGDEQERLRCARATLKLRL